MIQPKRLFLGLKRFRLVWIVSLSVLALSGIVCARFETPVAFQLDGRIETQHINAGQHVAKGQALFELDTRDLKQSIHAT